MEDDQNQQSTPAPQPVEQPAQQEVPPVTVTQQVPMPPTPIAPPAEKGSKKPLLIIVIVLILLIAGAATAWLAFRGDDVKSSSTDTSQKQSEDTTKSSEEASSELKRTKFVSFYEPRNTVTVEHPDNWEVKEYTEEDFYGDGSKRNYTVIGSPSGHFLHILNVDGIGGACEDNEESYTLTKKLATKTADVFFTEYSIEGKTSGLRLEYFGKPNSTSTGSDKHASLAEGQSNKNTCNIGPYPIYGGYVKLLDSAATNRFGDDSLTYAQVADDEAFLKMLQSLDATDVTLEQ